MAFLYENWEYFDGKIQQVAPFLMAGIEAYGISWVEDRISYHARDNIDQALVESLRACRSRASRELIANVAPLKRCASEVPF